MRASPHPLELRESRMARFTFPNLCSRCAKTCPDREWSISRSERSGNWETTYSIGVPVCRDCHSSLRTRQFGTWIIAVATGLILFVGIGACAKTWGIGALLGFFTFVFGGLFLGWCAGLG